jgi:hypothetical protein
VPFDRKSRTAIGGPFKPAAELVAGFWDWQVGRSDAAVELARRCPNPMPESSTLEIRPRFELAERDGRFRERTADR